MNLFANHNRPFACRVWIVLAGITLSAVAFAADPPSAKSPTDQVKLAERLEASKDARLDVELKTGRSFLRSKLLSLVKGAQGGPKTLRIQDGETGKTISIGFSSIRTLAVDRETIYEAKKSGKLTPREAATAKKDQAAAEANVEWRAKAEENGVRLWQELKKEEHAAAVDEHREMIARVKKLVPGMELYETHEFLFCSNMPRNQVIPYAASLDKMHDLMCTMYRIKKGTPIWRGKCLVMAFLEQPQFQIFESEFFQSGAIEGVYGLCHQSSTGRVVISCYRGDNANDFGQMLVHETSHGFIHRYRSMVAMPSWVNEGMAEWIGQALVPGSTAVRRKEQRALQLMQTTRSLNGLFSATPIQGIHYGMAASLTSFLIQTDKRKYADFIDGVKQGMTWEESLSAAYKSTPEQLIAAYGRALGIPDLRP